MSHRATHLHLINLSELQAQTQLGSPPLLFAVLLLTHGYLTENVMGEVSHGVTVRQSVLPVDAASKSDSSPDHKRSHIMLAFRALFFILDSNGVASNNFLIQIALWISRYCDITKRCFVGLCVLTETFWKVEWVTGGQTPLRSSPTGQRDNDNQCPKFLSTSKPAIWPKYVLKTPKSNYFSGQVSLKKKKKIHNKKTILKYRKTHTFMCIFRNPTKNHSRQSMWLSSPHGDEERKRSPSLHVSPTLVRTEINEPNRGVQQLSWLSQTRTVGKRTEWRQSATRREEIHPSHTYSSQQSSGLINTSEKRPSLFLPALSLLPLHSRQTIKLLYFFFLQPPWLTV